MEMQPNTACRDLLLAELSQRKSRNPLYSLRSFARDLGIGSTSLSDVLANKRRLSRKNIHKIADKLPLSPTQVSLLLTRNTRKNDSTENQTPRFQVQEDTFRLISEWYYLAILSLSKIEGNQADAAWIGNRLGISKVQAQHALERLIRMEFIVIENNQFKRTTHPLTTTRDIPSTAIKQFHQDTLRLAETSLFQDPVHKREFSAVTMAINPDMLQEAKDILMEAKRKVSHILEQGTLREVYTLSFQLFPLTKQEEPKK